MQSIMGISTCSSISASFKRRFEDVKAAERYEKECAVAAHVQQEARMLDKELEQMKVYPEIESFIDLFKPDVVKFRRPILALIGGTNLGKSMLAAHVLKRVAAALGLPSRGDEPSYLEVTVENNEHLDLSEFDIRFHGGVLLDGVGDALILKKNREALPGQGSQGRTVGNNDVFLQVHLGSASSCRYF